MSTRTQLPPTSAPTETPAPSATLQSDGGLINLTSSAEIKGGEFYHIAHSGQGSVLIYEVEGKGLVLALHDFQVEDGPDLHVYLALQDPVPSQQGNPLEGAYDLGALKSLTGDQTYPIPADLDLEKFHSVVIWCVPFNVPFIAASLQAY